MHSIVAVITVKGISNICVSYRWTWSSDELLGLALGLALGLTRIPMRRVLSLSLNSTCIPLECNFANDCKILRNSTAVN